MNKDAGDKTQWFISWSVLEQRALEFISVKHLRFLENFNQLFAEFDRDSDGRLSEAEFRGLVQKICLAVERSLDADGLLLKLDPANTQFVNYSGIVFVLSNEFLSLEPAELGPRARQRWARLTTELLCTGVRAASTASKSR